LYGTCYAFLVYWNKKNVEITFFDVDDDGSLGIEKIKNKKLK
jgi:hypothetical protein